MEEKPNQSIFYWDRESESLQEEKVYGAKAIELAYLHPAGRLLSALIASRWFSAIYGKIQSCSLSRFKVPKFVKNFEIPLSQYQPGSLSNKNSENSYAHFNEFFTRAFRPSARNFVNDPEIMPAFCEARYFGYAENSSSLKIPVKGELLTAPQLLGSSVAADFSKKFEGGPILIARLCPVDYHRFHFPDDGSKLLDYRITGEFHSVNPLALKLRPDIFIKNERHINLLKTKNFGNIAYIEVGATCVGKIVQTHDERHFSRGDEKGMFLFGGSTVIVLGEPNTWIPCKDIIENTLKRREVFVKLGEPIAYTNSNFKGK